MFVHELRGMNMPQQPLSIRTVYERFSEVEKFCRLTWSQHEPPQFELKHSDSWEAFASIEGSPKVVISTGFVADLYTFYFSAALMAPSFLGEDIPGQPYPFPRDGISFSAHIFEMTHDECFMSQAGARLSLAHVMFVSAIDFILLHEVAHITRGHLSYLSQKSGKLSISETDFFNATGATFLDLQAFELDADDWASFRLTHRSVANGVAYPISTPILNEAAGRQMEPSSVAALAVAMMFRMFGHDIADEASTFDPIHPPPPFRMALAAISIISREFKEGEDWWIDQVIEILRWSDAFWALQNNAENLTVYNNLLDAGIREKYVVWFERLARHRDNMKPELEPLFWHANDQ